MVPGVLLAAAGAGASISSKVVEISLVGAMSAVSLVSGVLSIVADASFGVAVALVMAAATYFVWVLLVAVLVEMVVDMDNNFFSKTERAMVKSKMVVTLTKMLLNAVLSEKVIAVSFQATFVGLSFLDVSQSLRWLQVCVACWWMAVPVDVESIGRSGWASKGHQTNPSSPLCKTT